ncbi:hypothetical protein [Priestia megaterium]|uniref:hypothetical protein n=1 Tax=Priestia megaterium TaxID=1404 RepID=UPI00300ADF1A
MDYEFQHSYSVEKPSSETHAWSFKKACDACLEAIEAKHGVDWKVTDITFEDLGRETSTHSTWDGKRTWKCTHTVKAHYNVVHRGEILRSTEMPIIEEALNITFKMQNVHYKS